ncbi:hypothetical protein [Acinetobacter sp. YH01009]|uniref:hypothetical protein n=1 Tax=Acinetobacter sp. YH01009 TaxID=2601025 RepID=UPI0015D103B7|nr:hypothetical protein [Acinetobacter sp. YH01009]
MKEITRKQIQRADLVFRGRMSRTTFLDHPAFCYSFESSGFKDYIFGATTGPSIGIDNLFHEMAHAIDFVLTGDDIKRRTLGGRFNFEVNMVSINGRLYEQLETSQCTMRECRAFAIQMKLMHIVGFKTNLESMAANYAHLTIWLPDWYLIEGDNETERVEWCKNHIMKLYNEYDDQSILNAFQIWLDSIQHIKQSVKAS